MESANHQIRASSFALHSFCSRTIGIVFRMQLEAVAGPSCFPHASKDWASYTVTKQNCRAGETAQGRKALAAMPEDLRSVPRTYTVGGESRLLRVF